MRNIIIDTNEQGKKILIPREITVENIEQQVKIFIEMADYSFFDGQLHIAHVRLYHGKEKTIKILRRILHELANPTMALDLRNHRRDLIPFFEAQVDRHNLLEDKDFGYPGGRSKLPVLV